MDHFLKCIVFAGLSALGLLYSDLHAASEITSAKKLESLVFKLENKGKNREALEAFERRSSILLPTPKTYLHVALSHFGLDEYKKTIDYAKKVLELTPENETAANLVFYSTRVLGWYEEGDALAKVWLAKPNAKETLRHISIFYTNWSEYDKSHQASTLGIQRLPNDHRMAGVHAFNVAMVEGKDAVIAFAESWTANNRPTAYFWEDVGKGLAEIDEHGLAVGYLKKAVELDPKDADVAGQLLSSFRGSGQAAQGIEWGLAWEKKGRPDFEFVKMMGALRFDSGEFELAVLRFKTCLQLDPSDATALVNLLVTLIELNEYEEAVVFGKNWTSQYPSKVTDRTSFYLGDSLAWNKHYEEAEYHYRKAIELAPQKPQYVDNLLFALNQQGKYQTSVDFYESWRPGFPAYEDAYLEKRIGEARSALEGSE